MDRPDPPPKRRNGAPDEADRLAHEERLTLLLEHGGAEFVRRSFPDFYLRHAANIEEVD